MITTKHILRMSDAVYVAIERHSAQYDGRGQWSTRV